MTAAAASSVTLTGGCHCGNIRLELDWPADDIMIAVRECQCRFCRKHGGTWTSHRAASLTAEYVSARVSDYRFGTRTAVFHVCRDCGVVPLVTSDIDGRLYAVVNVSALELPESMTLTSAKTDFDGETESGRLARRAKNWIPEVSLRPKPVDPTRRVSDRE